MHILVFKDLYTKTDEGGMSRFNVLAEKWADKNAKTTIISGTVDDETGERREDAFFKPFWTEEEREGITSIKCFSTTIGYQKPFGKFLSHLTLTVSAIVAGLFVKSPDVVIASSPPEFLGIAGWFISKVKKIPFVLETESPGADLDIELKKIKSGFVIKFHLWAEKFTQKKAKFIITNSPGVRAYLMKRKGVLEEKIKMIPDAVNFKTIEKYKVENAKSEMGWENNFVITYSGPYSSIYDFDTMLDLAAKMSDKKDVLFAFLGDGVKKAEVEKGVEARWLSNVVLLPAMSYRETSNALKASDVCMTATKKGVPLLDLVYVSGLFNYIAAGRPILLAGDGISAYLICESADCGACVEEGDSEDLYKKLAELYESKEKREELGNRGINFAKKHLDGEKLSEEYLEVLNKIISAHKAEVEAKKKKK